MRAEYGDGSCLGTSRLRNCNNAGLMNKLIKIKTPTPYLYPIEIYITLVERAASFQLFQIRHDALRKLLFALERLRTAPCRTL